jgi:hypothetical protein
MTPSSRTVLVDHLLRVGLAIIVAVAIFEAVCDKRISPPPTRPIPGLPVHRGEYQEYVTPFAYTVSGHFLGASYGPVVERLAPVVKQASAMNNPAASKES